MHNNDIFDNMIHKLNIEFKYPKNLDDTIIGFDKVKHIIIQYAHQDKEQIVNESLLFIRLKFAYLSIMSLKSAEEFYKIQRLYHILLRFVNKCKIRRLKVFDVEEDLCLVPFTSIDPRKIVSIIQNKCIYRFNITDLINIINTSLMNQCFMLPMPVMPKNPYTNIEFNRHIIINIFLRIWDLKMKMRPIFYYFYQCNFNISIFKNKNRVLLCDHSIDSYLSKGSTLSPDVIVDILSLIRIYSNPFGQINIHPSFPSNLLYEIFRPYLKLYYKMKLYNCSVQEEKLRHGLCCFAIFNPNFGRRFKRPNSTYGYDDRHLDYSDFTEKAFYDLRNTSVFEIIKKLKTTNSMFSVSVPPLANVKYDYSASIINYPSFVSNEHDVLNMVTQIFGANADDSEEDEEEESKIDEEEEEEEDE
jgi:hypothetical protein